MWKKLIKIPNKNDFNQLSLNEVGVMIDAFLSEGNEWFDPLAFSDFLNWPLKDEALKKVQSELKEKSFVYSDYAEWPEVDEKFLREYAEDLKRRQTSKE